MYENNMMDLMRKLFPICRSITGDGVRETFDILNELIPIKIHEVSTGEKAFDWTVPKEWNIKEAYIENSKGERVIDFKNNNLHVVGYSIPINSYMSLEELQNFLYSIPEQPEAIPYVTSYYNERWGFCLTHNQRLSLEEDTYHVVINSEHKNGSLTYGEILIPGELKEEIFLSTYICHPSMANNELSGPVLLTYLTQWIMKKPRKYSYRIVFVPETIGSITYLSRNLDVMKQKIKAGFNISCVGDERAFSFLPSRQENSLSDKVALFILSRMYPNFKKYTFLDRGSDERQYCSPGVDLPVASIMRTKYGMYPEYHTSLDNLELVTEKGLQDCLEVYIKCLELLEVNFKYKATNYCEPQLGKRGLYPNISLKGSANSVRNMMNFLAYCDGERDLIDISNKINVDVEELMNYLIKFLENDLVKIVD